MLQALTNAPNVAAFMFGVGTYDDHPGLLDYDPWLHAEALGARIVPNQNLPHSMPAAYLHELNVIFYRLGLPEDVEHCALTHELDHFIRKDDGKHVWQEDRANRATALRLIRPSKLRRALEHSGDIADAARELRVTEQVMSLYMRMARAGSLPQHHQP